MSTTIPTRLGTDPDSADGHTVERPRDRSGQRGAGTVPSRTIDPAGRRPAPNKSTKGA